jgi:CHAT domain
MSSLSIIEKRKIEKLLEMGSGYVLDFSNRTFQEFVIDSTGIDIYDDKYAYASGSKANRLRALWEQEPDQVIGKLTLDLLQHWRTHKVINDIEISQAEQVLYDDCSKTAEKLMQAIAKKAQSSKITVNSSIEKSQTISILLLSADPTNASRLRIGEELREIQEKLQLARLRDKFIIDQRTSVRSTDLSQALLDVQPNIVHFSGHGESSGNLCFEDRSGRIHPISPDALAALFEQFTDQVSCVLLNSCYSEMQAVAIANHINYVIGMSHAIGDHAAIAFAVGFYQALGAGRIIEDAYKLGCAQIRLQNIPEHLTPVLIQKGKSPLLGK